MNKQIEKLALECGAWNQVYEPNRFLHDHNFDIKKFAELIVQECIQVLNPDDIFEIFTRKMAQDTIKQHFGVEE